MKKIILLLLVSLLSTQIWCQKRNTSQEKVAEKFCIKFIERDYDYCWKRFDKSMNPTVNRQSFEQAMDQMHASLPTNSKDLEIEMSGVKMIDGKNAPFYSFKYSEDVSKPAGFLLDVVFVSPESKLVAGFQPKGRMTNTNSAASSKGNETVVSTKENITIDNTEYVIRGINIVHFTDNQGLIAVQVEYDIPTNKNPSELRLWAQEEGVKFAKWLYNSEHYEKSKEEVKKLDRTLYPKIGVSFVIPNGGNGYNIMIEETEYK